MNDKVNFIDKVLLMKFIDRQDAGEKLAKAVAKYQGDDAVVMALPRGGVVVGGVVAHELSAPLGVVFVRKIGHPGNPEYALGAVAEDEKPFYNQSDLPLADPAWIEAEVSRARQLIAQRRALYYDQDFKPPQVKNKTIILVDDGIATGFSMLAAAKALLNQNPRRLILAVPVAPPEAIAQLQDIADKVIVLDNPRNFLGAVGSHYQRFDEVTDDDVAAILREANM